MIQIAGMCSCWKRHGAMLPSVGLRLNASKPESMPDRTRRAFRRHETATSRRQQCRRAPHAHCAQPLHLGERNHLQTTGRGRGIVRGRVVLLLRSTEIQPLFRDLFAQPCIHKHTLHCLHTVGRGLGDDLGIALGIGLGDGGHRLGGRFGRGWVCVLVISGNRKNLDSKRTKSEHMIWDKGPKLGGLVKPCSKICGHMKKTGKKSLFLVTMTSRNYSASLEVVGAGTKCSKMRFCTFWPRLALFVV